MSRVMAQALGTGFLLGVFASAQERPRITVRVYTHQASVSKGALARAQKEAGRIFQHAGVEAVWLGCTGVAAGGLKNPACDPEPGPGELAVRIIDSGTRSHAIPIFGSAFAVKGGGFAQYGTVVFGDIEKRVPDGPAAVPLLLAYIMTHEVGHLLLGPEHSPEGVMRAGWTGRGLLETPREKFLFTAVQEERLRAAVRARLD